MSIIEVYELVKIYRPNVVALNKVTFNIPKKGLYIVAGPNGAGKTTLLRILYTALLPTSGEARVLDYDVVKEAKEIRKRIAVVPQDARPEPYLTPQEFVELYLMARGFSRSDAIRQARSALEVLGLEHVRNRLCLTLSGGEKQRVLVAAALATNAELLFLDEPTSGLDPLARRRVHEALRELVKGGHTIIVTTHLLNEAEEVADVVLLINRGRVLAMGKPDELKLSILRYQYRVTVREPCTSLMNEIKYLDINIVRRGDGDLVIYVNQEELRKLIDVLTVYGSSFTVEKIGLDDVFREVVTNDRNA